MNSTKSLDMPALISIANIKTGIIQRLVEFGYERTFSEYGNKAEIVDVEFDPKGLDDKHEVLPINIKYRINPEVQIIDLDGKSKKL